MSFEYTIKNFIIYNVFSLTSIKCCDDLLSYINKKWRNNGTQTKTEQAQVNILHKNTKKNTKKNTNTNTKEQWFQLHALINACIVYFSYNDVYDCLMDPTVSIQPCSNLFAGSFALMLHSYHSYAYQMTYMDKLHHGISVFLSTPLCLLYQTKGISMYYFFGTGLPGGIDYFLLSLVKQKKLGSIKEKKINSYLNTFIRLPGLAIASYLIWKDAIQHPSKIIHYSNRLLALLVFLNGTIFGKMAIENYKERSLENKIHI